MANTDIQGQITDVSGNPVANAEVYAWREDLVGSGAVVVSVTADTNGNFIFNSHPDGSGNSESWHIAAEDPAGNVQLQSAYDVTASLRPPVTIDDFETYSDVASSPYTNIDLDSSGGITTAQSNSAAQSLAIDGNGSGSGIFDPTAERQFRRSAKVQEFTYAYYETSAGGGFGVRLLDDTGAELLSVGSSNPAVEINNGQNTTLTSSVSPSFGAWRKFTISGIDYSSNVCFVQWEDLDGSSSSVSKTVTFLDNPDNVTVVQFGRDKRNNSDMGGSDVNGVFIDDVTEIV
jgi:hypothetical protein